MRNLRIIGRKEKHTRGYALIAVLFGLAVITLLFTSASRLTLSHARLTSDQAMLSSRMPDLASLITLAVAARQDGSGGVVTVAYDGREVTARFDDVAGRVDLNAASPALLETLLTGLGNDDPTEALARFRNWRRDGYRLQRVSDFARVSGISEADMVLLAPHVTVFSGRPGIAPESASLGLLEIISGGQGSRDYLSSQIPVAFRSPVTNVNYKVSFEGIIPNSVIVYLPSDLSVTKILAIDP